MKSVKAFNQISSVSNKEEEAFKSGAKYFMEDIAERINKLCDALDEELSQKPSPDLTLLIALLAQKVDEQELSEMLCGKDFR